MNRSRNLTRLIMLLIIMIYIFGQFNITFATSENNRTVYLIVLNKYTLEDIENMPNLKQIIDEGSIGLMNARGLYSYYGAEGYLTINSSRKAFTNEEGSKSYNLTDKNKEVYERRIGHIFGEYSVANLNLSKILEHNEKNSYLPYIGALGDNLHNAGLKTAVFGNADIVEKELRPSCLIPMDSKGLIDYGNVDNILAVDSEFPYGFRTDYEKMLYDIGSVKEDASFIVVDTGDLDRLSSYSSELTDEMFKKHRNNILGYIDEFIGKLKLSIDRDNSLLIILSPNGGDQRVDKSKLSPLILWGDGVNNGICTSATTKRDGVAANIDIGPTVLDYLGVSKTNMSGNPLTFVEKENSFNYINRNQNRINIVSNTRFNILTIYSIIIIIGLLLITIFLSLKVKLEGKLYNTIRIMLIVIGILPISFIISSVFNWNNYISYVLTISLISVILVFILYKLKKANALLLITGIIYTLLVLDIFTGGNLIRYSALGHDPAIGARYFGLGNELVGLFLGATITFASIIINQSGKKYISYILLVLSGIIVGYPKLGANVGGSIALLFAILYFVIEDLDIDISLGKIAGIGLGVVLFILVMAFIDIKFNSNPTHLGRAFLDIKKDGGNIANSIIFRKVLMNIKLVGTSIWTKVLFVNILCQGVLSYIWGDKIREYFNNKKYLFIGLISGLVGSIMGFLANDSGVILASISMTFITLFFLYTFMDCLLEE